MKKKFFLCVVLLGALLTSCYKDKGNYDYQPVSDITIAGIAQNYVQVTESDSLKIVPSIKSTYDTTKFQYAWVLYVNNTVDTIGRSRNLSYYVKGVPRNLRVMYTVKNTANGISANVVFNIEVVSLYSRGHYILKETENGNTEMDMFMDNGKLLPDLIQKAQSSPLQGKPRSMGVLYGRPIVDPITLLRTTAHCLGVITYDKKVGIYRVADMYKLFDHSNMFHTEVNDIPYKFYTNYRSSVYLSSTGVYSVETNGVGKYGVPTNEAITGASDNWAQVVPATCMVYWDETNRRILYHNYLSLTAQVNNTINFPTINLNYECVFMGSASTVACILFRNLADRSKMVLYQLTGPTLSAPTVTSITNISPSSKLHTATQFATNERTAQMIYFINANKLYYYNMVTGEEALISPQGVAADETITYVSNRFNYYENPKLDYFTVATFKNGNYNLYMYNMVGGLPSGAPARMISGKGKVKETHHVSTTYNSTQEANGLLTNGFSR